MVGGDRFKVRLTAWHQSPRPACGVATDDHPLHAGMLGLQPRHTDCHSLQPTDLHDFLPKVGTLAAEIVPKIRLFASSRIKFADSVAEWLACWTQAQKGPGSNRCRVTVLGKLFTPIVPLFTKQQNW